LVVHVTKLVLVAGRRGGSVLQIDVAVDVVNGEKVLTRMSLAQGRGTPGHVQDKTL
jgi:hypothetical protein